MGAISTVWGLTSGAAFEVRPHRLAGQTLLDGQPVQRRVEVRDRRTLAYIISTVSGADGTFAFRHLPPQDLAHPYIITCFDDRDTEYGNALVYDRVYQVDDAGNPPQT
ncbi:hypothetical protein [Syntrophotalea acetylenica]|jgi:hypothetical protein|uniref:hypothetical protein n=1 Tax=Syntrophotalea acetylenica TaxID=29542 RepID=UPI002A369D69|nr:hypothetical protein [Syntrophotalea acetylenica]MDY0261973.1 hypothetical protein [Syntrophotalea acetylenica]